MSNDVPHEYLIAKVSELDPAPSMRPFEAGETKGLLVRLPEGFHAVSGLCPHAQAPLHEGALCGHRLVCPWHQSVFDVTSGALLEPPALDGLERFAVRVQGDEIFVTLALSPAPALPAPKATPKDHRTVLVIGAGAAGQVAVETLRREGFGGRLVLVGPEPEAPYDRTNLSKHFLSGQAQKKDLPMRPEPGFLDKLGVERRITRVSRLDARAKQAVFADGETLAYDAAILATGGIPRPLEIPGMDHPRVCLLRSVADAEHILALTAGKNATAVAIGASFISLEAVSSLTQRGVKTTVLSPDEVPFAKQFGREIGESIRHLHEQNGVRFLAGAKAVRIEQTSGGGLSVHLANGEKIEADVAVVGVGVRPATDGIEGVEQADDGGVVVDEYLHAGHDLYAVGDIAQFPLSLAGSEAKRVRIEHWRVAQQHAALAARNVAHPRARESLAASGFVPFFWTFHFGQRMNYVGHARDWDEIVFDGDPQAPPFLAYYLRDGRTVAAVGTHRDADLAAMHELLRLGQAPTPGQLKAGGYRPLQAVG